MIPLSYRLRDGVRIEEAPSGGWRVVSELPLAVLRVNRSAAEMLDRMRPGAAVGELAAGLGIADEHVLVACERFRERGILEVAPSPDLASTGDESARLPSVSVVVPTKDRAAELDVCLGSLAALDYPKDKLEVIVVDDGSTDDTPAVADGHPCRYLANDRNRGQSYSRNVGARAATGEILAFIDSDCVASPEWLTGLIPYFSWAKVGGVGGLVSGYYASSRLDRYEQVASSLTMGPRLQLMTDDDSMGYVPTCNLLVRRDAYLALGGLRDDLRVGEDVDLCWRLRAAGHWLVYSPTGEVWHRHRDRLGAMLRRRAAYGTSEALLHGLHPEKRKTVVVRPLPALTVALAVTAFVLLKPGLLVLCAGTIGVDVARSRNRLASEGVHVEAGRLWLSAARGHLSFAYSVSFHLVRYYLVPLALTGVLVPGLWALAAAAAVYVTAVDHRTKKPDLGYGAFLGFSLAEHVAYQVGVALGCVRQRSLRSQIVRFRLGGKGRARSRSGGAAEPVLR